MDYVVIKKEDLRKLVIRTGMQPVFGVEFIESNTFPASELFEAGREGLYGYGTYRECEDFLNTKRG